MLFQPQSAALVRAAVRPTHCRFCKLPPDLSIENSPGLPRLTGPVNPAALSIKRTKPSIEIVDLTERMGLGSIAVDRNRLVL